MQDVAGETLRVDANQRGLAGSNIAHAKHDALLHIRAIGTFEAEDPEMAETARKIPLRYLSQHPENPVFIIMIPGERYCVSNNYCPFCCGWHYPARWPTFYRAYPLFTGC